MVGNWQHSQLFVNRSSTFLNGALHWLGYHQKDDPFDDVDYVRLVLFDTTNEAFRETELPEAVGYNSVVIVHGKLLSLLGESDTGFNIWVMREYGVPESWIKVQFTINLHKYEKVLEFRENGKLLLLQIRQLVLYDLQTDERKLAICFPRSVLFWGENYVETLALLDGSQGRDNSLQSNINSEEVTSQQPR